VPKWQKESEDEQENAKEKQTKAAAGNGGQLRRFG
jgi:hypothetical protein